MKWGSWKRQCCVIAFAVVVIGNATLFLTFQNPYRRNTYCWIFGTLLKQLFVVSHFLPWLKNNYIKFSLLPRHLSIHNQKLPNFPVGFAETPVITSQQCLPNLSCKPMRQAPGIMIHSVAYFEIRLVEYQALFCPLYPACLYAPVPLPI